MKLQIDLDICVDPDKVENGHNVKISAIDSPSIKEVCIGSIALTGNIFPAVILDIDKQLSSYNTPRELRAECIMDAIHKLQKYFDDNFLDNPEDLGKNT